LKATGLYSWQLYFSGLVFVVIFPLTAFAERVADVANTKHNFSASPTFGTELPTGQSRDVTAVAEQQICVFCHTPHAGNPELGPLWNREMSGATYDTYRSASIDAVAPGTALDQPNGISKLCLSCHDGTLAIGAVNVLNGTRTDQSGITEDIRMQGTGPGGTMAPGEGPTSGFTRHLGTDLTNDHPISLVFDQNLVVKDGEMRSPDAEDHIKVRQRGTYVATTEIPLEHTPATTTGGLVQCNSCHDPHIRDTSNENIKFLRLNRLQKVEPVGTMFSAQNDIICLACHDKAGWVGSAHANPAVANEAYTNEAAQVREFAPGTQVWESACLACHDTHTAQGSRRLLREGVDGTVTTAAGGAAIKFGDGLPAIEEACFACHSHDANTLVGQFRSSADNTFEVPNIKYDFLFMDRHMPITNDEQLAATEIHDIGTHDLVDPLLIGGYGPQGTDGLGKDFIESAGKLGRGTTPVNRHAECTDCHNPHRVIKNRYFYDDPATPAAAGTHDHDAAEHSNLASGVLRGIWGVEPDYGAGTAFGTNPTGFRIKRGNPQSVPVLANSDPNNFDYVTREYQICLKCHSNYAYGDLPPELGYYAGGTPSGTNGMTRYTNQAMEYQSPVDHMEEGTSGTPSGAFSGMPPGQNYSVNYASNNHRGWHPVMRRTGRTPAIRQANENNWISPFNRAVGTQTMYCSDCHGSSTAAGTVVPNGGENGSPWGPHGSNDNFLLKGPWSGDRFGGTGEGARDHLCFKCHEYDQYAGSNGFGGGGGGGFGGGGGAQDSGFATQGACFNCGGSSLNNLHTYHAGVVQNFRCNICHVAVPHGWKNKAFLVNLNDVGIEAGLQPGTQVRNASGGFGGGGGFGTGGYTQGPYYNRAGLKIHSFATSGNWTPGDCGSSGAPGNGQIGVSWMAFGSEACMNLP